MKREDGKWVLLTVVYSPEDAGRFVIGLAADLEILEGERLRKHVRVYGEKYIKIM